jgi:N-acetylmuramoyl-L-alanine amidase
MTFWKIFSNKTKTETPKDTPTTGSVVGYDGSVVVYPPKIDEPTSYDPVEPIDLMKVKFVRSPNQSNRKGDVKFIVLHHTGPGSFNGIVNWLTNPQAKASAHYVLGTSAQLNQLVNTTKKSWHAGISKWDDLTDLNNYSIGIEIQNLGLLQKGEDGNFYYEQGRNLKKYTGKVDPVYGSITYPSGKVLEGYYVPYPEKQLKKLVGLCKALVNKYELGPYSLVTHYEIGQPEGRKNDPFGLDLSELATRIFM